MLKGGGTVEPVSKKDIQSLVRENFHSVSDFSEIIWKIENFKVSLIGVDSLWGDHTIIPADWGS